MSTARISFRREHVFEIRGGRLSSRPDETWSYVDPAGHIHRWVWNHRGGDPPRSQRASLPTCRALEHATFLGQERRRVSYKCAVCGAPVEPGLVDAEGQRYLIDDTEVSYEEFAQRAAQAGMPVALLK